MPDVFTTRHSISVSEKTHGGRAVIAFRESFDVDENIDNVPIKQNPNDLRRNSDIIDEQPIVNRFMDPKELEWQKRRSLSKSEENPKKSKSKDKPEEKKPEEENEDSKYFCCS